ncbi:unnamed protein product, partial [Effrenium voratum]
ETAHTVAQLPPTCKEALAHAVIVRAGGAPRYFPPGWGPLCLCWGWFGLGALMGACFALLWLLCRPARGAPAPQPPWLTAAREALDCVAEGGHAELRGLAGQARMPVEELLCHLLRKVRQPGRRERLPQEACDSNGTNPPPTVHAPAAATSSQAPLLPHFPAMAACTVCQQRPASEGGRCLPCIAVATLQHYVHGPGLPPWADAPAEALLCGTAAALRAVVEGPPPRTPSPSRSRSRSRTPLGPRERPPRRGGRRRDAGGAGKGGKGGRRWPEGRQWRPSAAAEAAAVFPEPPIFSMRWPHIAATADHP